MTSFGSGRSGKSLRATNDRYVTPDDFIPLFADIFDTLLYKAQVASATPQPSEVEITSNENFWLGAQRGTLHHGSRVVLRGFYLTEWLPSAPGRFHTEEAARSRQIAEDYWESSDKEYVPLGKEYMVLGGVGCLRLRARTIDGQKRYICGASSTGVCHEGLAVTLSERDFTQVIGAIKDRGGCLCNLFGVVDILPSELALINYHRNIPRCAISVDGFEMLSNSLQSEVWATAAIMFPSTYSTYTDKPETFAGDGYETRLVKSWSFASFTPDRKDDSLKHSVAWLADYAARYSRTPHPPLLTDFDEHRSHFDCPVEFGLARTEQSIDGRRLSAYGAYYNITFNVEAMTMSGDIFKNIQGSTIINRSNVEKSFNRVSKTHSREIADALVRLAKFVAKSNNQEAGEILNEFNLEAAKEQPKKSLLKTYWQGLTTTLPSIVKMTEIVDNVSKLFTS